MNRVAAIQKSSRTMTTHCTRPPSHCRRACTSSVFGSALLRVQPLLELVENDQHLLAGAECLVPGAMAASVSFKPEISGQRWAALPQAVQQAGFRLVGGGFDVDGDHVRRTVAAAVPPSPATTCRSPRARRSGPRRTCCRHPSLRSGSSRSEGCRASPSRSRGPGSSSRKKSASWASNDRKPFGTILMRLAGGDRSRGRGGERQPAWECRLARSLVGRETKADRTPMAGSRPANAADRRPGP